MHAQNTEHVETVIIGGGQAGLATGFYLAKQGRPYLILDAHEKVGDNWRRHWDSLRLYSPASHDGLPGMPFPADRHHFPTKDEVADYLAAYAEKFQLQVQGGTKVDEVSKNGEGYVVQTRDRRYVADNVVVATGTFGRPKIPELAAQLRPEIRQFHSTEYKRLADLRPGPVLVVGGAHSGSEIAYEVATEHETVVCGRDTGQIPVPHGSRRFHMVTPVLWFVWNHVLSRKTPIGRKVKDHIRFHGGPNIRAKKADLAARGVERVFGRVAGVQDGLPVLEDGRVLDVTNVVWATGFRQDFSWIKLPVIGDDNYPLERFGVVDTAPGLYFMGLSFQRSFASMLIGGAGKDAAYIAKQIAKRAPKASSNGHRKATAQAAAR